MNPKLHRFKALPAWGVASLILFYGVFCSAPAAYGAGPAESPPAPMKIIAVIPPDFPPTYYRDETTGQASGFSVDVMNEVGRRAGFAVEYIYAESWDLIEQAVLTGKADLVPTLTMDENRLKRLIFTVPVETLKISLIARASDTAHNGIEPGMKIGIMKGSSVAHFLGKRGDITLLPYPGLQQLLLDLLAGRVDLAMTAASNILKLARDAGIEERIRIIEPCQYEAKRGMALRPGNEALRDQLNAVINQFVDTLEYQRLYQKWWGKPAPLWNTRRVAGVISGVIAVLTTLFLALRFRERRRTNEELRKSEQKYRLFIETAAEGVWALDAALRTTFANLRMAGMLGYKPEEMLGKLVESFLFDEDLIDHRARMAQRQQGHGGTYERRFRHKDGSEVWTQVSATAIVDEQGRFTGTYALITDITERKRGELALAERRRELEVMHRISEIALRDHSLHPTLQQIVQEVSAALGFPIVAIEYYHETEQEMLFAAMTGIPLPADGLPLKVPVAETLSGVVAQSGQPLIETRALDRPEYAFELLRSLGVQTFVCVPMFTGTNVIGTLSMGNPATVLPDECFVPLTRSLANFIASIIAHRRSVVEKATLEGQLYQAQKMDAIGRLAGGVAHDFNNMLSIIMGYADLALETLQSSDPLYQTLREILSASHRSSNVVRQLLAFARKQTITPKVLDLNPTVENMLKMLRRLIGEDIDLLWKPADESCPIKMDPSQIDQLLANLAVNARDAIRDVGKITIETADRTFDADYCKTHAGFKPGDYVMLAVSDNGSGMDKETLANLFEPFFTTKEHGKGTGLGLATVYGIVKQNNGFINVYSEPGQGSTFKIYIPRCQSADRLPHETAESIMTLTGEETVLLVEDEHGILQLAKVMLEKMGYTVLAANTPEEAIRLAEEYAGEIHLLMTDVIMPGMNGRDLSNRLLARFPKLKSLFMSGYTANVIAHHGVLDEGVHFIHKPFSKKDLAVKIRKALDQ